jgi:NAD(P)H-nitrite reductase large subunit
MANHHVIVGGGPAATNAIETIRQFRDARDRITMVCDEPAHSRMALPYWLADKISRQHTYTGDEAYFQKFGVDLRIGDRATSVDVAANRLGLSDGSQLDFDRLLIATGSSPSMPSVTGLDLPGVQPLWTLEHTQSALDYASQLTHAPRVVLIGAGFIGLIVLNAMFKRGWTLTVVEREGHVLPRMLDQGAAGIVEDWLAARDVRVHTGADVQSIETTGDDTKLVKLADGRQIEADMVVVATGIKPNLELTDGTGIQTDRGILVNDRMQSSCSHVYAAGDVAQGPVLYADRPEIHAIQPTAVDHGRVAGANMAGADVRYPGSLLMNIVDVCGLQCASFGRWNDENGDQTTIANGRDRIYRKLLWNGERLVGAIFAGEARDMGMLNDVGMVKGILQTQTPLGPWKAYLSENPFDIRRVYIATGVAKTLSTTTLLGTPTRPRSFHFGGQRPEVKMGPAHAAYVATKGT